uniref:Uncharacterized protein n=1 Tax=Tanacetum cinerariifolium TaxID=118510 RepID=A0A6L2L1L1_TANCI|nr:hypothetical protein [Tanacetum cinerariifolium]
MPYLRFTKVIISHFISKDKTISMRNMITLHTIHDKSSSRKARKYKKVASPLRKLSLVKEAEPVRKTKRVKRPAKKSTTAPTVGVVIRDTPGVSVSKKKAPAKADRSKGVPDEHQRKRSGTDAGTGTKPGVLDVPKYQYESDDESWGDNDVGNDAHEAHENKKDDALYKDVDVRSLRAEHEKERIGDEETTDADKNKTESSKQSSSVSSDFATKFLILDNVPQVVDEVASIMNVKNHQEESSTQAPSLFTVLETAISKTSTTHTTTVPLNISMITPLPQLMTPSPAPIIILTTTSLSLTEFKLKKILLDKIAKSKSYQAPPKQRELYDGLIKSYNLDKDLYSSYGNVYSLKRIHKVEDKNEDPPAGSNQGLKKQKTNRKLNHQKALNQKNLRQAYPRASSLS